MHPVRTGGASARPEPPLRVLKKKKKKTQLTFFLRASDNTSHHIGPSGVLMPMGIYDDSDGMNVGGSLARVNGKLAALWGSCSRRADGENSNKNKVTHRFFFYHSGEEMVTKRGKK